MMVTRRLNMMLPTILILSYIVSSLGLECPADSRPLPPSSCIELQPEPNPVVDYSTAQSQCLTSSFDGLPVLNNDEFPTLVSYTQVLVPQNQLYWLGYMYSSTNVLQDVFGETVDTLSAVLNESNYDSTSPQEDMVSGVCLAIGGGGGDQPFYRVLCSRMLPYFCHRRSATPTATITVSPDRFVTIGSDVTLTCSTTGSIKSATWRATLPGSSEPMPIDDAAVSINSFSIVTNPGAYYCIVSNELGSSVSEPVVLLATLNATADMNSPAVTITQNTATPTFNSSFSVTCDYTTVQPVTTVQWFINGRPVEETSGTDGSSSTLVVDKLQEEGYYQCFMLTENGDNGGASVLVNAQPGRPGPVDDIMVIANNRTQLFVSWYCPEVTNIHDPALLRYNILYHQGSTFNASLAVTVSVRPPESNLCIVEYSISGVDAGIQYAVKIIAIAPNNNQGEESSLYALATTYGSVPGAIQDLKVFRSVDAKTVFADWDNVVTMPPMGVVSRYMIHYRDANKGDIISVIHSSKFSYLVVLNVMNANTYEVRVSSGVIVQRNPVDYEYSEFSSWVKVDGIATNIPSVPPTGRLGARVGAIAGGVVVAVLVAVMVGVIISVGCVCLTMKRREKKTFNKLPVEAKESVEFQKDEVTIHS